MHPLNYIKNLYPILQSNSFPFLEKTYDDINEYAILARLQKAINVVISNNNILNDNFTELNNNFANLTEYVNNYFENLDVQDEIDKKLQEMAESGELSNLILEFTKLNSIITFKDINDLQNATNLIKDNIILCMGYYSFNDGGKSYYLITDIKQTEKDITLQNNLYATPINKLNNLNTKLTINLWLQWDIEKVKKCIDSYVFMGVSNIILPLHLTGDTCELTENYDTINQAISYCKEKGLNVTSIKIHCSNSKLDTDAEFQDIYKNKISEILTTLNAKNIGITNLIILNERNRLYTRNATEEGLNFVKSIVTYFKNSGYLVSISMSTLKQGLIECINTHKDITDMLDFLCFNEYPIVGDYGKQTTEKDSYEIFGNYINLLRYVRLYYPSKKILWSEIGVQNVYETFSNPANYEIVNKPNATPANGNVIPIYFKGLLENQDMINLIDEICLWYTEYYFNYYDKIKFFRDYFIRKEN